MGKLTIFHNSRCSTCRNTLALIEKAGKKVEIVNYLDTPPSPAQLKILLTQMGKQPIDIVRTKEALYTELGLKEHPPKSVEEWVTLLSRNPILIERPIVTNGERAVLARPPENVLELLK